MWGAFGEGRGEAADQRDLGVFGHPGGEDAGALGRVERRLQVQGGFDTLDCRLDQRGDLAGLSGGLHAGGGADKQIVVEQGPQSRQRVRTRRPKVLGNALKALAPEPGSASRYLGRTEFDSVEVDNEVIIQSADKLPVGEFVNVRITKAYDYDLEGEVC